MRVMKYKRQQLGPKVLRNGLGAVCLSDRDADIIVEHTDPNRPTMLAEAHTLGIPERDHPSI